MVSQRCHRLKASHITRSAATAGRSCYLDRPAAPPPPRINSKWLRVCMRPDGVLKTLCDQLDRAASRRNPIDVCQATSNRLGHPCLHQPYVLIVKRPRFGLVSNTSGWTYSAATAATGVWYFSIYPGSTSHRRRHRRQQGCRIEVWTGKQGGMGKELISIKRCQQSEQV